MRFISPDTGENIGNRKKAQFKIDTYRFIRNPYHPFGLRNRLHSSRSASHSAWEHHHG